MGPRRRGDRGGSGRLQRPSVLVDCLDRVGRDRLGGDASVRVVLHRVPDEDRDERCADAEDGGEGDGE